MPQNAVIKADGSGDYTTLEAWRVAEEYSNYGEPTTFNTDGLVEAGAIIVFNGSGGRFPHGIRGRAVSGQEFDGTNAASCARIRHSSNLIEAANVDIDLQGLALAVTGGYNNEAFKVSNTISTTQRRNITLKNCYIESAPFYHGSTHALEFNTASYSSGGGSRYNLDIENVVVLSRASNRGVYITGRDGDQTFTGSVKNVTVLPTNSGTSATNAFWIGTGNDSSLVVDKILSMAQEVRTNVVDYVNEGMGGSFTNISTNDDTGTVTGVTTATELENYAAGDYRLKSTGSGNGAFVQSGAAAGAGSTTLTATAVGVGYRESSGYGSTVTTATASGAGYRLSHGAGISIVTAVTAGTGDAPLLAPEGAGSTTLTVTTTGVGYRMSVGAGLSAATLSASGAGYRMSQGAGSSTALTVTASDGYAPSIVPDGYGGTVVTVTSTGAGYRASVGAGVSAATLTASGSGYRVSQGSGSTTANVTTAGAGAISARTPDVVIYTNIERYVVHATIERVVINA